MRSKQLPRSWLRTESSHEKRNPFTIYDLRPRMIPELPIDPRQALEASLTALLLGELPAEQAEFLQRTIAQDPELAKQYERLKQTIELVRETELKPLKQPATHPAPLKLSDQLREELLRRFKTITPEAFAGVARRRDVSWLLPVAAAFVIMALVSAALLPVLSKGKSRSKVLSMASNERARPTGLNLDDRDEIRKLGRISTRGDVPGSK